MSPETRSNYHDQDHHHRYRCRAYPAAAPATAKTQHVSVTVEFGDLDLSTQEGAETLTKRFDAAISMACGRPDMKSRVSVRSVQACRKGMTSNARLAIAEVTKNATRFAGPDAITVRG